MSHGNLSSDIRVKLDNEVQEILKECVADVEKLFKREHALLTHVSEALLEKEELTFDEIEELFNKYATEKPQKSSP